MNRMATMLRLLLLALIAVIAGACTRDEPPGRVVEYNDKLSVRHGQLKLLWTERYEELERSLERQHQRYRAGELPAGELTAQLRYLRMADPAFAPRFAAWNASRPESSWAPLLEGLFLLERAWAARGGLPAAQTSRAQWDAAQRQAREAVTSLERARERGAPPALWAAGLINVSLLLGQRDDNRNLLDTAMAADGRFWEAPAVYFQTLYPQWGGSEEAMSAFIAEMRQPYPELARWLESDLHFRRGLQHQDLGEPEQAQAAYERAIALNDHGYALKNLASLHLRAGRCVEAVAPLRRHLEQIDDWDLWTLETLHQAYVCQEDWAEVERVEGRLNELMERYRRGV